VRWLHGQYAECFIDVVAPAAALGKAARQGFIDDGFGIAGSERRRRWRPARASSERRGSGCDE